MASLHNLKPEKVIKAFERGGVGDTIGGKYARVW
jgi:hypothetical protein